MKMMMMMMTIMKTMMIKMKMAIAMAMMMMMINVNPKVCTVCLLAQAGAVGADDLAANARSTHNSPWPASASTDETLVICFAT